MGLFSWNCKGCGQSIKSPFEPKPAWHNDAVVILAGGTMLIGSYDGYGRIDGMEFKDDDPCMWHQRCWENAGKPTDHNPSDGAEDQGYFYPRDEDEEELE
jgi:hypothetical protein